MKKLWILALSGLMVLSTGVMSFADSNTSPAEIYADAVGISIEEAYEQRAEGETFGDLARENGVWEAFADTFMEQKIEVLQDKVESGDLSQEDADAYIDALENCDGTGEGQVLKGLNFGFGRNSGMGQGNGAKNGSGLRDGSGSGQGSRNGQGVGNGQGAGNGQGTGNGLRDGSCLVD